VSNHYSRYPDAHRGETPVSHHCSRHPSAHRGETPVSNHCSGHPSACCGETPMSNHCSSASRGETPCPTTAPGTPMHIVGRPPCPTTPPGTPVHTMRRPPCPTTAPVHPTGRPCVQPLLQVPRCTSWGDPRVPPLLQVPQCIPRGDPVSNHCSGHPRCTPWGDLHAQLLQPFPCTRVRGHGPRAVGLRSARVSPGWGLLSLPGSGATQRPSACSRASPLHPQPAQRQQRSMPGRGAGAPGQAPADEAHPRPGSPPAASRQLARRGRLLRADGSNLR